MLKDRQDFGDFDYEIHSRLPNRKHCSLRRIKCGSQRRFGPYLTMELNSKERGSNWPHMCTGMALDFHRYDSFHTPSKPPYDFNKPLDLKAIMNKPRPKISPYSYVYVKK